MLVRYKVPHLVWSNIKLSFPWLITCSKKPTELHWILHNIGKSQLHHWRGWKWSVKTHAVFKTRMTPYFPGNKRRILKFLVRSKDTGSCLSLLHITSAIEFRISCSVLTNMAWKLLLRRRLLMKLQWLSYMMAFIELLCIPDVHNLNLMVFYHPSACSNVSYCACNA